MQRKHDYLDLDSRFDWAIRSLKEIKQNNPAIRTVFDIGSGSALLKEEVVKMGLEYFSFDLFPPNEQVRKWNVDDKFPYEGKADVIIFLEILEHLNNPWLGMTNVADTLNPGGTILISTPNPSWSEARLVLLSKGALGLFTENDLEVNHHVFTPWQHIVRFILEDSGFRDVQFFVLGKKTHITDYPFWGLKLPFRVVFRLIKKIIESRDKKAIGATYGTLARKK
jgi:SAM-dependent methyltransferase